MTDRHLAGQVAWLFPLALIGFVLGTFQARWSWPLGPNHQALLLWFGWAVTYGVVYSVAGGIFHPYYLVTMAPPYAALAGIGMAGLWSLYRQGGWRASFLPLALVATAAWQGYVQYGYLGWKVENWEQLVKDPAEFLSTVSDQVQAHLDWKNDVMLGLLGGTLVAVVGLLGMWLIGVRRPFVRRVALGAAAIGWLALLTVPVSWALTTVLARGNLMLPAADPALLTPRNNNRPGNFAGAPRGRGAGTANQELLAFLQANHQGERFLLATSRTSEAAPIIIETGEAVMAMGGFMGSDPMLTVERFEEMVKEKQIRFVMVSGGRGGPRGANGEQTVTDWIREHGKPVDRSYYQKNLPPAPPADVAGGQPGGGRQRGFGRGGAQPGGQAAGGRGPGGRRQRGAGPGGVQPGGPAPGGQGPGGGGPRGFAGGRGGFGGFAGRGGGQLYDCRPEDGLVRVQWDKD